MKILLVSSTFPPRKFGGITKSSYILAKNLVKKGHEVTVYTTDANDRHSRIADIKGVKNVDGIKVYYFKNLSNWLASRRLYLPLGMAVAIKKELNNFDIVHLNEFRSFHSIIVHYYTRKYNIPYVLQARGSLVTFFYKGWLKKLFDIIWGYRILKDAAKLIALTTVEAEQYRSMSISKDRIAIVPNGIDLSEFDNLPQNGEFRRKYGLDNKQRIVLFIGRIHKIKGPDLLARAFADLVKVFHKTKLVIAGPDDGYLPVLKNLIQELNIEQNVLFTGPLYGTDKLEAYLDADVYVLPSVSEAFPNSVLEACACGTPVIITNRCGIADVIDNQAGFVVPYEKDALAQAMVNILTNDKKRQKLGEQGKLLVREKYNWEDIVDNLETLYRDCISV